MIKSKYRESIELQNFTTLIQANVPLADKNWFKTGGNARHFCEPENAIAFAHCLQWAREYKTPIFVLGQGANILISDDGFDGLVIRPQLKQMVVIAEEDGSVYLRAEAGVTIHDLIEFCLHHNILGLEEFSGIPGTVGGSIYINLHYFEFLLEHFLIDAHIINHTTGKIETVIKEWFSFGYNQSHLHKKNHYLVSATFKLKKGTDFETAYALGRRAEIIRHRQKRYPSINTCGSFFRNFIDDEVTIQSNGKKMIYVAYYLDKIGVKGQLHVGDAIVSHQHANMIVNCGNATSNDIITLASTMQERVYQEFGILPQPECLLIGFKEYPLLK